jgi:serine/threonine protein kinase
MHANGFAHRDLKLENVFLDSECTPKIGDFGLVKSFKRGKNFETYCGTEGYMAPEIQNQDY